MLNIFNQFPIVSEIVTFLPWEDLSMFKKLNSLCYEVTEREELKRCNGICFGHQKLEKNKKMSLNRKRIIYNNSLVELKKNFQCKNPKLILIMSNENDKKPFLEDLLLNQCHSGAVICYLYYHHGNIGTIRNSQSNKLELNYSFSRQLPAFSWLCLPIDIDARVLSKGSDVSSSTKLVIVFNTEYSKDIYAGSAFPDDTSNNHQICYCGGLIKRIELFDHSKRCFVRSNHISIAIGGDNFHVFPIILNEEHCEIDSLILEFSFNKENYEEFVKDQIISYQCALVFSCYFRNSILYQSERKITEYELFSEYFPNIPINGIMSKAQIFHLNSKLIHLVKGLHNVDLEELSSVYLILVWTK